MGEYRVLSSVLINDTCHGVDVFEGDFINEEERGGEFYLKLEKIENFLTFEQDQVQQN